MTTIIDYDEITKEIINFLRNSDIYSVSERNVTTASDTGTFAGTSTHLIAVTNIKNIRSIVVAGTTLSYGTDYTLDLNYDDSGDIKTQITFTSAQTGNYTITYDYGTDIIFPDYPRSDLKVSSFPRIAVGIIGDDSDDNELSGESKITSVSFSVSIYSTSNKEIDQKLKLIRSAFIVSQKNFYNLRYVLRASTGSLGYWGDPKNNIKQRNVDYLCPYNIEIV